MKPVNSLKKIIISNSRIKLLQVLLYQPNEMFYIRQLTRKTKEKLNSVRRELLNLEEAGILKSEWRGNKLFYWADTSHALFEELLAIVLKTKGLGREIIANRHKLGKLKFVVFSGRFARNLPKEKKDEIDVLVVGGVVLPELGVLIREEEEKRGREINYTVMDTKEFQYRKKNRDPFLTQIMLQSRVMIVGDELTMVEY
jgi:hypothetical protein